MGKFIDKIWFTSMMAKGKTKKPWQLKAWRDKRKKLLADSCMQYWQ